ncbi:MAG TPA: hypothetical protein VMW28_06800 [Pelolinea sp.]|nr:hypothetical protein [Pelolinea sp.]
MVGVDKKKLVDILKEAVTGKEEAKKVVKPTAGVKGTPVKKPSVKAGVGSMSDGLSKVGSKAKVDAFLNKRDALSEAELKKQIEILHSKTHQDLINAAYKAAEKLKIAPWVLLRAAEWGHFTDNRGKKYDGPAIDEIEGLEFAQKVALKEVLGIK